MAFSPTLPAVIHSGDYFLFESDSEEEEEALPEDPRPSAQSAFQVRWEGPLPAFHCPWAPGPTQPTVGRRDPLASPSRSFQTHRVSSQMGCRRCRS